MHIIAQLQRCSVAWKKPSSEGYLQPDVLREPELQLTCEQHGIRGANHPLPIEIGI